MGLLTDDELLEYINRKRKLRRPSYLDINTDDTDVYTGDMVIFGAAYMLMIKKFKPDEITTLCDMTKFLVSLERGVNEYLKDCTDKEKCEQFPEYVRVLTVMYHELLARGIKAYPFVKRLQFDPKSLNDDAVLLEFVNRVKEIPLPSSEEIKTTNTNIPAGTDFILGAADLLLIQKAKPAEISLPDMKLFLGSFERGVIDFERTSPDKKKCEQYLHFMQMLKAIYYELIERGIKTSVLGCH